MDINPISTKRIYQSVIEQFIAMLKDGKITSGQKLPPERALAEMFDVSRASIREAFSAMEIIGMIEVRPGDGSFVTQLNIAPFINTIAPLFLLNKSMEDDLLDFRKMLELAAVRSTIDKASKEDISLLLKPIRIMRDALDNNDPQKGVSGDIGFHKTLFMISKNLIITKAAECINYILESSVEYNRAQILKDKNNAAVLCTQHQAIYSAILDKDPVLAEELMRQHLDFVKETAKT